MSFLNNPKKARNGIRKVNVAKSLPRHRDVGTGEIIEQGSRGVGFYKIKVAETTYLNVPVIPYNEESSLADLVSGNTVDVGYVSGEPFVLGHGYYSTSQTVVEIGEILHRLVPLQNFYGNMGMTRWLPNATKEITPLGFSSNVLYTFELGEIPGVSDNQYLYTNQRRYKFTDDGDTIAIQSDVLTPNIDASNKYPDFEPFFDSFSLSYCGGQLPKLAYRTPFVENGKVYWWEYLEYGYYYKRVSYYQLDYDADTVTLLYTADNGVYDPERVMSLTEEEELRYLVGEDNVYHDVPFKTYHYCPKNKLYPKIWVSTVPSTKYSAFFQYFDYSGSVSEFKFDVEEFGGTQVKYDQEWKYWDTSVFEAFSWDGIKTVGNKIYSPPVILTYAWPDEYLLSNEKGGSFNSYPYEWGLENIRDNIAAGNYESSAWGFIRSVKGFNRSVVLRTYPPGTLHDYCEFLKYCVRYPIFTHDDVGETVEDMITFLKMETSYRFVTYDNGYNTSACPYINSSGCSGGTSLPLAHSECFSNSWGDITGDDDIRLRQYDQHGFFGDESFWDITYMDTPDDPFAISGFIASNDVTGGISSYPSGQVSSKFHGTGTFFGYSNNIYAVVFTELTYRHSYVVADKDLNEVYSGSISWYVYVPEIILIYYISNKYGVGYITDDSVLYTTFEGYDGSYNHVRGVIGIDLMTADVIYMYKYIWDRSGYIGNGHSVGSIPEWKKGLFFYGGCFAICEHTELSHAEWRWILLEAAS